ncbi:hypothetical protein [Mycobacterium sp. HNNTM2301]|uniref:hypothetical protein n=1 Tax=Mycobacterium hainanense TaxID=3289775 RepID=UPI0035A6AFDC
MSIVGDWDVSIKTPVGTLQIVYSFDLDDGVLTGRAAGKHETVPCIDIDVSEEATGQRVRWRQSVTKPMKLKLDFDVLVEGDRLTGNSRAGRLPRSTVIGTRR